MKKAAVDGVVVWDFMEGVRTEEGCHFGFEGAGEEAVDIVVAVIGENEAAVLNVLMKIGALAGAELNKFVAADIGEGVAKNLGTVEFDNLFLQVDGEGSIFYQGIEEVGWHALVGIPISGPVAEPHKCKFVFH